MIQYEVDIGEDEKNILIEILLQSNANQNKRRKVVPILIVLALVSLVLEIHCLYQGSKIKAFIALIILAFSCFLLFRGSKMLQKLIIKRAMSRVDKALYSGKRKYVFDDNGVEVTSFVGNGKSYWSSFSCWGMLKHYIYIQRVDNQVVLVDKNKLSKNELDELLSFLANVRSEVEH